MSKKYNAHVIRAVVKARYQNEFRYYVAIGLLQQGKSYCAWDTPELAKMLNLSPKTVQNNLYKLQKWGWLRLDRKKNRIYPVGQNKLPHLDYGAHQSRLAVHITPADLGPDLVAWRAFLYKASLAAPERNIARTTLQAETNHHPRTQRKYEKITGGIKKRFNYAVLEAAKPGRMATLYYEESVGMGGLFNQNGNIVRQIPNTYWTDLELGYRAATSHHNENSGANACSMRSDFNRRYLKKGEKSKNLDQDRVYQQIEGNKWRKLS